MNDQAIEQEIQAKGLTAPRVTPADIEAEIAAEYYFTAADAIAPPVGKMVDRFLGWPLPKDFAPDCGISFRHEPDARGFAPSWPTGTNVFHAGQAKEMFEHALGKPAVPKELGLLTFCVLVTRNGLTVTGESACASPENFDAEVGRKIARQNATAKLWPLLGFHPPAKRPRTMIPHPASPTRGDHLRAVARGDDKPEPITRAQGGGRHADRFDELRADLGPFWLAWIAIYAAGCAGSLWLTVLIVRAWVGH